METVVSMEKSHMIQPCYFQEVAAVKNGLKTCLMTGKKEIDLILSSASAFEMLTTLLLEAARLTT